MSNFKVGEKVVWISNSVENKDCIIPKVNDIITLKSYVNYNHWDVVEYPVDKFGKLQCLDERNFRKLDTQFAEDVCAQLIEEFKQETILN